MTERVSPFPLEALPRTTRRTARLKRALRGWLALLRRDALTQALQLTPNLSLRLDLDPSAARLLASPPEPPPGWVGRVRVGDAALLIVLDPATALALTDHLLNDPHADERPARPLSPLEHGLLTATLAALLARARLPQACVFEPAAASAPRWRGETLVAPLQVVLPQHRGAAQIIAPLTLLKHLEEVALTPNPPARLGALPIPLRVERLRLPLRAAELHRLEPGALLLTREPPSRAVWLASAGARIWRGHHLADGRLALDHPVPRAFARPLTARRSPVTAPPNTPSTDDPLATLPVEVVVEAGRLSIALNDLAALAPGDVLTTEAPLTQPVELTVGGRLIARGELVNVEGLLGVRVTETHLGDMTPEP